MDVKGGLQEGGLRARLHRLFQAHPVSMGETYWQHQRHALCFGSRLIVAGLACVIHALVPALFVRTGSTTVVRLREQMAALGRLGPERYGPDGSEAQGRSYQPIR